MRNKLYILSIIVLLCICCTKEPAEQEGGVLVNFTTILEKGTKVGEYFEAGEKLGLFGYDLEEGKEWNEVSVTPDFMYNEVLEYTGNKWITHKEYYWSENANKKRRFYAYYPYTPESADNNIILSQKNVSGAPYIDFTVTNGKTDFIVCGAEEGSITDPIVQFTAKHALAKLSIGFATDIPEGFAYVKALKVNGVIKQGRFSYDFDATATNGFTYNNPKTTIDLELAQPSEDIVVDSDETVVADEYILYLLPLYENEGKGSVASVETVINGVEKTFNLSNIPFRSGKNTIIRIVINQKDVKFTATIEDWETGGSASGIID